MVSLYIKNFGQKMLKMAIVKRVEFGGVYWSDFTALDVSAEAK